MTRLSRRTATTTRFSPKAARNERRQGVANIRSGRLLPRRHSPDGATWTLPRWCLCVYLTSTWIYFLYYLYLARWCCRKPDSKRLSSDAHLTQSRRWWNDPWVLVKVCWCSKFSRSALPPSQCSACLHLTRLTLHSDTFSMINMFNDDHDSHKISGEHKR